MALIHANFFSEALGMCASCEVILPQPRPGADNAPLKNMLLLHPIFGNASSWMRMTSIERYAEARRLAVIMPDASLSSYYDMVHGLPYFRYLADELPAVMRRFFPLSDRREDCFVCGASMGGYGALKLALLRPERFGAVGSLSSGYTSYRGFISREYAGGWSLQDLTFGPGGLDEEDRALTEQIRRLAQGEGPRPRVFITVGSEDRVLLENSREARDAFRALDGDPFDFHYSEHPGGHDWDFWDRHIRDFFDWAGL